MLFSVPNGPPEGVQIASITSKSVTLLWQPPTVLKRNGEISGYILKIASVENNYTDKYKIEAGIVNFTEKGF